MQPAGVWPQLSVRPGGPLGRGGGDAPTLGRPPDAAWLLQEHLPREPLQYRHVKPGAWLWLLEIFPPSHTFRRVTLLLKPSVFSSLLCKQEQRFGDSYVD